MLHTESRQQLRIEIETKECGLEGDELARLQDPLDRVSEAVNDLPAKLKLTIVFHPNTQRFHARADLELPRRSLFTGDWDQYFDTAVQRCLRKLTCKIEGYHLEPEQEADRLARQAQSSEHDIVAPTDPESGPIAEAVAAQDYKRFRELLSHFDEWLNLRIGRWIQRYPAIEAELGDRVRISDVREEIFLNAFERYAERSGAITLHEWLEDLIDPSLQELLRHTDEEEENISQVRTLRETPLDKPTRRKSGAAKQTTRKRQAK